MNDKIEPKEAFPYQPPTDEIRNKFSEIFNLTDPLPNRFLRPYLIKLYHLYC